MMDIRKSGRRRAAENRRGKAGETLTETLVAMLIVGLASVLFLTMVGASGRIFRTSKEKYNEIYEKIAAADVQSFDPTDPTPVIPPPTDGTVTVTGTGTGASTSVEVKWYGEAGYVFSYKKAG